MPAAKSRGSSSARQNCGNRRLPGELDNEFRARSPEQAGLLADIAKRRAVSA
jgi:hypothetical protein